MVVFELLLAHLLGDFVFQSNDLIHRKYKSWMGTAEHVCYIAFFTVLFLFPYWNNSYTWGVVAIIFSLHFVQDVLKIQYDVAYNKKKSTLPFFVDQLLHIALITYLAPGFEALPTLPLPEWVRTLYFSQVLTVYLVGMILVSATYDITRYQFIRQRSKKNLEYKPDRAGLRRRSICYSALFAVSLVLYRSFM